MTMDHTEALDGHAVERYLLGEMTETEAESFERHFFECAVCSEELAAGALLAENARALPAAEAAPVVQIPRRKRFAAWWSRPLFAAPAFAAAMLACVAAYQARELAYRGRPQALVSYTLKSESRGEEVRIRIPADASYFAVNADLPDTSFPEYRCELYDDSGSLRFSVDSPAPPPGSPLGILLPARGLRPGAYTLRVHGLRGSVTGPEIARYRFSL
jgi:hypothetical protein